MGKKKQKKTKAPKRSSFLADGDVLQGSVLSTKALSTLVWALRGLISDMELQYSRAVGLQQTAESPDVATHYDNIAIVLGAEINDLQELHTILDEAGMDGRMLFLATPEPVSGGDTPDPDDPAAEGFALPA